MEILSIPVITALTQLFKGDTNKRLVPFISLSIGIIIALLLTFKTPNPDYIQAILDGIMVGLGASGLYSGGKTILTPTNRPT